MPASQIISNGNFSLSGGQNQGTTRAVTALNTLNTDTIANEEFTELPVREAGVFDRAWVYIDINTLNAFAVLTFRVSRTDPAGPNVVSITVGAGQTGTFEDMTGFQAVAASDEFNWKSDTTAASSGNYNAQILSLRFTPTDATKTISWAWAGGSGGGLSTNNATRFWPISGTISVDATENNAKGRIKASFTSRDLTFHVASNARSTNCTVRTRINAGFGNQTVTIGAGQTGVFEDTTNTDTLVSGDDYCYSITTLGGGGLINSRRISTTLVSTNRQWLYSPANVNAATFLPIQGGNSYYHPFAGNLAQAVTTEAVAQVKSFAHSVSKMTVFISANNFSATYSVALRTRINGANGTLSIAIASGVTGLLEDTTHSDSITLDQLTNIQIQFTGVTIPTGQLVLRSITMIGETAPEKSSSFFPLPRFFSRRRAG